MSWRRKTTGPESLTYRKDPRYLHVLSYGEGVKELSGQDMWEGKIRLIRKSVDETTTLVKVLTDKTAQGQDKFKQEMADLREQMTELKNEQKRTLNDKMNQVMQEMNGKMNAVASQVTEVSRVLDELKEMQR